MAKVILKRLSDSKEIKIISEYAQIHGWDHDECGIADFIFEYYEDYEEYREWYLMMVA